MNRSTKDKLKKITPRFVYRMYSDHCTKRDMAKEDLRIDGIYRRCADEMAKMPDSDIAAFGRALAGEPHIRVFAGEWTKKYKPCSRIVYDRNAGMLKTGYETFANGIKTLFFPVKWSAFLCSHYVAGLHLEQDKESPHLYFTDEVLHAMDNGGAFLDIGVAEGNFTLEFIDKADRAYLFEPDPEWQEPLEHTLSQYTDKIVLTKKFVSDKTDGESISVDDMFGENIPDNIKLIKMDIEGFEQQALRGMEKTLLRNPGAILLICVYHKQNAEAEIHEILSGFADYDIKVRGGYMFFYPDPDLASPYARHGVIECRVRKGDTWRQA